MSRWAAVRERVRGLFHRHTPGKEKAMREQENFVIAAEAVTAQQRERLNETIRQLDRVYRKEYELMRGLRSHVDR